MLHRHPLLSWCALGWHRFLQQLELTMARKKPSRPRGRRPVGLHGEKVSEYPQVMIRLPHQTKTTLDALSGLTGMPIWRLVDQAVEVYVQALPEGERKLLSGVRLRRASLANGKKGRS
jgi:hypothetical protein